MLKTRSPSAILAVTKSISSLALSADLALTSIRAREKSVAHKKPKQLEYLDPNLPIPASGGN